MDSQQTLHEYNAERLVEYCRNEFKWTDLSKDVIMDLGCGEEGNCGKAILEKFPVVGSIVFIDNNPKEIFSFQLKLEANMELVNADIEKRDTLRNYAGKMDKVISTYVFHQIVKKEEAFRNVYHLLKPGGEAAIMFITKSLVVEWHTELIKKPKWKSANKYKYIQDMYKNELGADYYRKMVERIGFRVVDCKEEELIVPYLSDQDCKESLYKMAGHSFNVPSEEIEEFKEDCLQVLLKLSERDDEGKPCYRSVVLSILLTKPTEGCSSKVK